MFSTLCCCGGIQSKSIDDSPKCDYIFPEPPRPTTWCGPMWSGGVRSHPQKGWKIWNFHHLSFELSTDIWTCCIETPPPPSTAEVQQWQPRESVTHFNLASWSIGRSQGMWGILMNRWFGGCDVVCLELNNRQHHHCRGRFHRHCCCYCPTSSTFRWFLLDCVIPLRSTHPSDDPFVHLSVGLENVDFHGQREKWQGKLSWTAAGGMEIVECSLFVYRLSTASDDGQKRFFEGGGGKQWTLWL